MSDPIIYQRKPLLVTAQRFSPDLSYPNFNVARTDAGTGWKVETAGGWAQLSEGEWLVCFPDGKVSVFGHERFQADFEPMADFLRGRPENQVKFEPNLDASLSRLGDTVNEALQQAETAVAGAAAEALDQATSWLQGKLGKKP